MHPGAQTEFAPFPRQYGGDARYGNPFGGQPASVGAEQILLCTDITQGWAADTEKMVRAMQEKHLVRRLSDAPKTLVLCRENGRVVCYLTGVGLRTLSARMREDRSFFLRLMERERQETGRSEVQHVERIGSGD